MSDNQLPEGIPARIRDIMEANPDLMEMMPDPAVTAAVEQPDLPFEQAIDTILAGYTDRPALGMRDYEIAANTETGKNTRRYLPSYSTSSYGDLQKRVRAIASAFRNDSAFDVQRDELVSIIGFASTDYIAIMLACMYAQAIPSPLQSVTSTSDLDAIFSRVQPKTFAATAADLVVAANHAVKHKMRNLIVFDYDERDDEDRSQFEAAQAIIAESGNEINLTTLDKVVEVGEQHEWTFLRTAPEWLRSYCAHPPFIRIDGCAKRGDDDRSIHSVDVVAGKRQAARSRALFCAIEPRHGHARRLPSTAKRELLLLHGETGHVHPVRRHPACKANSHVILSTRAGPCLSALFVGSVATVSEWRIGGGSGTAGPGGDPDVLPRRSAYFGRRGVGANPARSQSILRRVL